MIGAAVWADSIDGWRERVPRARLVQRIHLPRVRRLRKPNCLPDYRASHDVVRGYPPAPFAKLLRRVGPRRARDDTSLDHRRLLPWRVGGHSGCSRGIIISYAVERRARVHRAGPCTGRIQLWWWQHWNNYRLTLRPTSLVPAQTVWTARACARACPRYLSMTEVSQTRNASTK